VTGVLPVGAINMDNGGKQSGHRRRPIACTYSGYLLT
jgi:hypothetical protein